MVAVGSGVRGTGLATGCYLLQQGEGNYSVHVYARL